jgi:hypothetical protein
MGFPPHQFVFHRSHIENIYDTQTSDNVHYYEEGSDEGRITIPVFVWSNRRKPRKCSQWGQLHRELYLLTMFPWKAQSSEAVYMEKWFLCLIKQRSIKKQGEMEVQLHTCLTMPLHSMNSQLQAPSDLFPLKEH